MEVHAHTHTERKKFTHYLWEFLMLFLAVFCGFLAENFREHLIEHQREKGYMHSLVEDLRTDTADLNDEIDLGYRVSNGIAHLVSFINNEPPKDSVEKLYRLYVQSNRVVKAAFEDRTSSQLKNAGDMRLVRKQAVADSIRSYWSIVKEMEFVSERLEQIRDNASSARVKLFNNKYIWYTNMDNPVHSDVSILPGAKLINDDPKLLAEYANWLQTALVVLNNYIRMMNIAKIKATNLVLLIKKEYSLQ